MGRSRVPDSRQVDELVASVIPLHDVDLPDSSRDRAARDLFLAITGEPAARLEQPAGTARGPRYRRGGRSFSIAALAVAVAAVAATTLSLALGTTRPAGASVLVQSVHGVPLQADLPAAAVANGVVDWAKVPALVGTVVHGKVIGYVRKADLRQAKHLAGVLSGPVPPCGSDGLSVYSAAHRLTGHIFADAGYTPVNAAPRCSLLGKSPPPTSGSSATSPTWTGTPTKAVGVLLPDVRSQPVAQAQRQLTRAGFVVKVMTAASPGSAPGTVVSQTPAPLPGARLSKGSEVVLTVAP